MSYIDNYIDTIISAIRGAGLNKSQVAEKSKVRSSTLRYLGEDSWNPEVETLRKIEAGLEPELANLPNLNTSDISVNKNKSTPKRSKK